MSARTRSLLAGAVLAAGCGGAVPPPSAPAEVQASPSPPPARERPRDAPPPAPPVVEEAKPADAGPILEPLLPLARPIVSVTLPGVDWPLTAVQARSPHEVWFLGGADEGGCLVRYDPPRVVVVARWTESDLDRGISTPSKRKPAPNEFMKVFSYGPHTPGFSGVFLGKDEVMLTGSVAAWARGPGMLRGALRHGKWSWESSYWRGLTVSSGEHVWELNCSPVMDSWWTYRDCSFWASGGPPASFPSHDASYGQEGESTALVVQALQMRGLDDGWIVIADEGEPRLLLRYNGVTWAPVAAIDAALTVVGLWGDEAGNAWIAARRGGKDDDPANVALRFDGHALRPLPVPASFAATSVTGTGPEDVWFLGAGRKVYQWDGQRLRVGEAPFDVGAAWASTGGEMWVVGDGKSAKGVVGRVAPRGEVR
jgi:hypothetical protein